jgi:hypothetical protein
MSFLKKVEKLCNEASAGKKVSSGTISATFPYVIVVLGANFGVSVVFYFVIHKSAICNLF